MLLIKKDITTVSAPAIIMHGVNCQGVMGSGVARTLYEKWPDVKTMYLKIPTDYMKLGVVQFVMVEHNLWVYNCFTQEFFGKDGKKYADPMAIRKCLSNLFYEATEKQIFDIYTPKIGCGLGGLDWEKDVLPEFEWFEAKHPEFNITICELGDE